MLPPWLSALFLTLVFLLILLLPGLLRWELVRDLEALLFLELAALLAAPFFLPVRLEPSEETIALAILSILAATLAVVVGPVVGVLVPTHLVARAGKVWRAERPYRRAAETLVFSLASLWVAWMAVGLVWIDDGRWSANQVPRDVWWEVPSPGGARLAPHAVPVFGMLYFGLITAWELSSEWISRLRVSESQSGIVGRTSA
jgi:hypothetical protein